MLFHMLCFQGSKLLYGGRYYCTEHETGAHTRAHGATNVLHTVWQAEDRPTRPRQRSSVWIGARYCARRHGEANQSARSTPNFTRGSRALKQAGYRVGGRSKARVHALP